MRFANAIRLLAVVALLVGGLAVSGTASAQVAVEFSVGFAPPPLPVYEQPICPGEGYIWTPGYWAWDDDDQDYYWVPGTWVEAPQVGYLWHPDIGDGAARPTFSMWVIGDRWWDSMAALITAGATPVADITADDGITTIFTTTAR